MKPLPHRAVWMVLLAGLFFHVAQAVLIPLVADEAYYALWARWPDLSYYDHPAMVAWWIWLGENLIGGSVIGVRLVFVASWLPVALMVWRMTVLAGGTERASLLSVLWFALAPVFVFAGFVATPDLPSVFFWTAVIWLLAEIASGAGKSSWIWLGLCAGLGVVAKFTNLFLGLGLVVWLLFTSEGRRWLRTIWPWLALAVSLLAMAPVVLWNLEHDWLGLERQFGRISNAGTDASLVLAYIGTLFFLGGPFAAFAAVRRALGLDQPVVRLLVLTMLPFLLFLLYHSTTQAVAGNWLMPVYPALSVLAGLGASNWKSPMIWLGAGVSGIIGSLALALGLWPGQPMFPGNTPINQVKGWGDANRQIASLVEESDAVWIASDAYGLVGLLSYYHPDVDVWGVAETYRYVFRDPFPSEFCGARGLFIGTSGHRVSRFFDNSGETVRVDRTSSGAIVETYFVTPVSGLRSCPF